MEEVDLIDDVTDSDPDESLLENQEEEVDLYGNKKRHSFKNETQRRVSLGLPDNGAGLTKDYYNISRVMSVTSLVDLIVMRRTGAVQKHRKSNISSELEERVKKTLAWKEIEDDMNKEDIMVNFRKKMRDKRREARQNLQTKEIKIERRINEERRIHLRTSLVEPQIELKRKFTTESIKDAIKEFKSRYPDIIDDIKPDKLSMYENEKEVDDVLTRTRDMLVQMGYLNQDVKKDVEVSKQSINTVVGPRSVEVSQDEDNVDMIRTSSKQLSRSSLLRNVPTKVASKQSWKKVSSEKSSLPSSRSSATSRKSTASSLGKSFQNSNPSRSIKSPERNPYANRYVTRTSQPPQLNVNAQSTPGPSKINRPPAVPKSLKAKSTTPSNSSHKRLNS